MLGKELMFRKTLPTIPWQVSRDTSSSPGTSPSSSALHQIPHMDDLGYYHAQWPHHWTLSSWVKGKIHVGSRLRSAHFWALSQKIRKGIDWVSGIVRCFHIHLPRNLANAWTIHSSIIYHVPIRDHISEIWAVKDLASQVWVWILTTCARMIGQPGQCLFTAVSQCLE